MQAFSIGAMLDLIHGHQVDRLGGARGDVCAEIQEEAFLVIGQEHEPETAGNAVFEAIVVIGDFADLDDGVIVLAAEGLGFAEEREALVAFGRAAAVADLEEDGEGVGVVGRRVGRSDDGRTGRTDPTER